MKYKCYMCNKIFDLRNDQIWKLINNIDCKLFCSRSCNSKYTTTMWHQNKTDEEKQEINNKIKNTLLNK